MPITIEEFEQQLHEFTPLEAKFKSLLSKRSKVTRDLKTVIAEAKQALVEEGYAAYAQPYEPVDIRDGFITYTDKAPISAIYQSRYLPVYAHIHYFIEAIFVYQGQCRLVTGDSSTMLYQGDFCIVSPACRHDHNVMDDHSIILLIAIRTDTFNDSFFSLLQHHDILSDFFVRTLYHAESQQGLLFRTGHDPRISSLVLEMHYERAMNLEFCGPMLATLLNRLLLLLLRNHQDHVELLDTTVGGSSVRLVPILRDIQTNLRETSLAHLAQKYGYSVPQLSRLIKNHTGKTYGTVVRELRAQRAAKLLENPEWVMLDIAEVVGYFDVSHFYREFRRCQGLTPGQYRTKALGTS